MSSTKVPVTAIIQARMGSTRLPGKVLMPLGDETVLSMMLKRLQPSRYITDIVVATTTHPEDAPIIDLCKVLSINTYQGSETDVLARYYEAAQKYNAQHIIRLTADCPLQDFTVVDNLIQTYLEKNVDYAANAITPTYPDGFDAEIFSFKTLAKAYQNAALASEREHVTPYIHKHPQTFSILNVPYTKNVSHLRLTLDEPKDYQVITAIVQNLFKKDTYIHLEDILNYIDKNSEVLVNQTIERNEGYKKSLANDNTHPHPK